MAGDSGVHLLNTSMVTNLYNENVSFHVQKHEKKMMTIILTDCMRTSDDSFDDIYKVHLLTTIQVCKDLITVTRI